MTVYNEDENDDAEDEINNNVIILLLLRCYYAHTPDSPARLPATRQTCAVLALADGILENCNNWQDPQNCAAD